MPWLLSGHEGRPGADFSSAPGVRFMAAEYHIAGSPAIESVSDLVVSDCLCVSGAPDNGASGRRSAGNGYLLVCEQHRGSADWGSGHSFSDGPATPLIGWEAFVRFLSVAP